MSTCLGYEARLKTQFSSRMGRLRVYPTEKATIVCYAEDTRGQLSEPLRSDLEQWWERFRLAGFRAEVRPYSDLENDGVPPRKEIPVYIQHLAITGNITVDGFYQSISKAFPELANFKVHDVTPGPGELTIEINGQIDPTLLGNLKEYVPELTPPGIITHFKLV